MVDIWGSIKDTAESLGGAAYAPVGAVVDIAQMPFDDKDDSFGSVLHAVSSRAGDVADPLFNPQTLTGSGLNKALAGMNWAWLNGVSQPIATANMAYRHTFGGLGNFGPLGALASLASGRSNIGDLFDAQTWSEAYKRSKQQDNPLGAAFSFGALKPTGDPLAYANPYETVTDERGALASTLGWTGEIVGSFAGDPTYLGLKAAGVAKGFAYAGKLSTAERANLLNAVVDGSQPGRLGRNLASRTDRYLDWIGGENKLGRPLSAPEILHGSPELKRYATEPHVISGLLADANSITDLAVRRDAQRRILAVAGGDTSQIARLRAESSETAAIADQLHNLDRGATIDLLDLGKAPTLRTDPQFMASLEAQLDNLNKPGDIDKWIDGWSARFDQMLGLDSTVPNLPGAHPIGERAIGRLNDKGLLRTPQRKLDDWSARMSSEIRSTSSVFQKGLYSVPLVAVKTVGFLSSPYTKVPDALRQTQFVGVVHLDDWGGATSQLDSMMKLTNVPTFDRMKVLNEAFIAKNEPEKLAIIQKAEKASTQALIAKATARTGHEVDADYLDVLMEEGYAKRAASMAALKGRAYAATEMPEAMAARMAGRAEDAAALAGSPARLGGGLSAKPQGKWRLDQINDDGTPLALPVLETQLSSMVPLLDVHSLSKAVNRDTSYLSRLSKAWKAEAREVDALPGKRLAGAALGRALEARRNTMDWLVQAGQIALRAWKMSVLFRLGYPMRVLTDDHLRIWSKIGAGSLYMGNGKEFLSNAKYNQWDRRVAGRNALHDLKVERQQIVDELDGDLMAAHLGRQADLRTLQNSMRGKQRHLAGLRTRVEEAETKHSLGIDTPDLGALREKLRKAEGDLLDQEAAQTRLLEELGDYSPDDLKRRLTELDGMIDEGTKALRPESRVIGSKGISLAPDFSVEGAFGGEFGPLWRDATTSGGTFDALMRGAEDRSYRSMAGGSHRVVQPSEAGHLDAWADVLNHQIRNSPAAVHFLKGGVVDDFVRWVRKPEQADLRRRLAHFAHDPEDWGNRVKGIVFDYTHTDEIRQAVLAGRVTPKFLGKALPEELRPAVHGRVVADNLGSSAAVRGVGNAIQRVFTGLSELPTDYLTRHPYFNSMYKMHAQDIYDVKRAGGQVSFTAEDAAEIALQARKRAMRDLKTTLFDLSAHSHAAHVLRFVSPFFAAHQEGISRWWRIAADNPQVVRRLTQAMDVPRYLGIEVDENGDLVKPGAPISRNHRILLQLPQAFGGKDPETFQSKWSISENAFNIILQGGLTNPGMGPLVTVPMEWAAQKYADDPSIAKITRVFNPYPPQSPMENLIPATLKRLSGTIYGATGIDPSLGMGIGKREYNAAFSQNVQDAMVDFQLKNGREPTSNEAADLVERAGREATTQMFHRFLWNSLSPAPASPRSKYAAIQQGWYKIAEQARAENKDFDWAYAQFKDKYGEAYMPLVYSTSNNPAWVDADPASVSALKHYKGVLKKVDPALTRMVIGAYADDMIAKDATLGEYSPEARNYLRSTPIKPGSSQAYYSYDEPAQAVEEQMARRGWQKYNELTAGLMASAQGMGLASYEDDPNLVAIKRAAIEKLKTENYAFAKDYDTVDSGQYDRYLADMRDIVAAPVLANDTERTDIQTLGLYLKLRDFFGQVFEARKAAGLGGFEAQAQDQVRQAYTGLVDALVESNTYFQNYVYDGVVDRDPWLLREAS